MGERFYACYLLTPVNPTYSIVSSYIGYTVDPLRRLRQHNREITAGAKKTGKYRPWEIVVFVAGFPSSHYALQFEWIWQHPYHSKLTRDLLRQPQWKQFRLGKPPNIKRKLKVLDVMCSLAPFRDFNLEIGFLHLRYQHLAMEIWATSPYTTDLVAQTRLYTSDQLQQHMKMINQAPATAPQPPTPVCGICHQHLVAKEAIVQCYQEDCDVACHLLCFSEQLTTTQVRPTIGSCPFCERQVLWRELIKTRYEYDPPIASSSSSSLEEDQHQIINISSSSSSSDEQEKGNVIDLT